MDSCIQLCKAPVITAKQDLFEACILSCQEGCDTSSKDTAITTTSSEYFLAAGGESCDDACEGDQGTSTVCDQNAIIAVAKSDDTCKSAIESLGLTPLPGGWYPDNNAGCCYYPDGQAGKGHYQ